MFYPQEEMCISTASLTNIWARHPYHSLKLFTYWLFSVYLRIKPQKRMCLVCLFHPEQCPRHSKHSKIICWGNEQRRLSPNVIVNNFSHPYTCMPLLPSRRRVDFQSLFIWVGLMLCFWAIVLNDRDTVPVLGLACNTQALQFPFLSLSYKTPCKEVQQLAKERSPEGDNSAQESKKFN